MKKPTSIPKLVLIVGVILFNIGLMFMDFMAHPKRISQPDGTSKLVWVVGEHNDFYCSLAVLGFSMILSSGSYMVYRKVKGIP